MQKDKEKGWRVHNLNPWVKDMWFGHGQPLSKLNYSLENKLVKNNNVSTTILGE